MTVDVTETDVAQDAGLAKVWDDPELDSYNDCDANKSQAHDDIAG